MLRKLIFYGYIEKENPKGQLIVNGQVIKLVKQFCYLGRFLQAMVDVTPK